MTPELKAFEDKALSAGERALARERQLYDALLDALAPHLEPLVGGRALARLARCAGRARRVRQARRLVPAAVRARAVHRDRARPPSGRRGAAAGTRPRLHAQRLPARRQAPDARHHRPEHGRQEHLHAPGRADRAAGLDRLVRAGGGLPARADRRDPHPHRRRRRPRQRAVDLHGRDDRGSGDRAHRDRALAGADGRDRPRHLDLRRPGAGRRHRPPPARPQPLVHALRDALFRAHRLPGRSTSAPSTSTSPRSRAATTIAFLHEIEAGPGEPQLRRAGGAPGRHAARRCCARRGPRSSVWRPSASRASRRAICSPPRATERRRGRRARDGGAIRRSTRRGRRSTPICSRPRKRSTRSIA